MEPHACSCSSRGGSGRSQSTSSPEEGSSPISDISSIWEDYNDYNWAASSAAMDDDCASSSKDLLLAMLQAQRTDIAQDLDCNVNILITSSAAAGNDHGSMNVNVNSLEQMLLDTSPKELVETQTNKEFSFLPTEMKLEGAPCLLQFTHRQMESPISTTSLDASAGMIYVEFPRYEHAEGSKKRGHAATSFDSKTPEIRAGEQSKLPPRKHSREAEAQESQKTQTCKKQQQDAGGAKTFNQLLPAVGPALNTNGKPRARRGSATDPQSVYARHRREKINERLRTLQHLVPNGAKVDIVTMLEEAIQYVKFLQLQVKLLSSDEYWIYSPTSYNGAQMQLRVEQSSIA